MRSRNKRRLIIYGLIGVLMLTTVAYATLQTVLNISGTVVKKGNLWNIYFTNPSSASVVGSATGGNINIQASSLTFSVNLYKPGDKVTYTVDVKNGGTIDATLNSISLTGVDTAKSNNVNYTVTYSDGSTIKKDDLLNIGSSKTLKIVVEYDYSATSISSSDINLTFGLTLIYNQTSTGSSSSSGSSGITSNNIIAGIYGNSIQNGTPTVTNPVAIQSVGEKTKNLFDASSWNTITKFGITIEYLANEDCFLINGTVPDNKDPSFVLNTYQIKTTSKSATYTISTKYVSGTVDRSNAPGYKYAVAYFGKSDDGSTYVNWNLANLEQYDTSASSIPGTNYIDSFWFYISPGVSFDNYKVKIQLEQSDNVTTYEPYGYKIPITVSNDTTSKTSTIYLKEPLRKIGNYADYLDLTNGKVIRSVKEKKFDGTEYMSEYNSTSSYNNFVSNVIDDDSKENTKENVLSNYFLGVKAYTLGGIRIGGGKGRLAFNLDTSTSLTDFKTWIQDKYNNGNPLVVDYILEDQIEEIVEVPSISSLEGNVTYIVGTSIQPSNINYTNR